MVENDLNKMVVTNLEKNDSGQRCLKIYSEWGQGAAWTVEPVERERERDRALSGFNKFRTRFRKRSFWPIQINVWDYAWLRETWTAELLKVQATSHEGVCGSGGIATRIHNIDRDRDKGSDSRPDLFTLEQVTSGFHWMRDCVGPREDLDALDKKPRNSTSR
jgi:hypothetical protein